MNQRSILKDKLIAIIEKYDLLAKQMASPEIFSNQEKLTLIAKEHRSLEEIVIVSKKYNQQNKYNI